MQAQTENDIRTSGQVDPKSKNSKNAEYRFNNTLYEVKSVFKGIQNTELLEDKIKRLILGDMNSKHPAM